MSPLCWGSIQTIFHVNQNYRPIPILPPGVEISGHWIIRPFLFSYVSLRHPFKYIVFPSSVVPRVHVIGCCMAFILIVDVCYLCVCVCVWAFLLYNEERRVKCRIVFQDAPWDVHLKRLQCLCVKVIDILPVSPAPLSFLSFSHSLLPQPFHQFVSLVLCQFLSICIFFLLPLCFSLLICFFFFIFQLVSSDTPAAEPPVAVVPPVETPAQPSPPPPPLPPPPAERTGGIGDSRPPSFQ